MRLKLITPLGRNKERVEGKRMNAYVPTMEGVSCGREGFKEFFGQLFVMLNFSIIWLVSAFCYFLHGQCDFFYILFLYVKILELK